jgi:hypothetical protein
MSFIQRELDRIGAALTQPQPGPEYAELYAAQQALVWALEPTGFKAPYDAIVRASILGGSEDCQEGNGLTASSGTPDHRGS